MRSINHRTMDQERVISANTTSGAPKKSIIMCIIGTRPEVIKMAPVIKRLRASQWAKCVTVATAQHRDLLDQELLSFGIEPDIDLDIMTHQQSLGKLTSKLLAKIDRVLLKYKPDAVLAQGDTTTVFATALGCFYRDIPFGHVEAGLRSGDFKNPFPEEFNRFVCSKIARWHFAPTKRAKQNLIDEGINENSIYVTGNTVIDSLLDTAVLKSGSTCGNGNNGPKIIVVTIHRRENFGFPLRRICGAIIRLSEQNKDVRFVIPVHPNPNVYDVIHDCLGHHPRISLCKSLDYVRFVLLLKKAYLVLSDSGGLQEEGPALGKPVLVLREKTERTESIAAGVAKLVGTDPDKIIAETQALLDNPGMYQDMAKGVSPYGDGHAAERIVEELKYDCCRD